MKSEEKNVSDKPVMTSAHVWKVSGKKVLFDVHVVFDLDLGPIYLLKIYYAEYLKIKRKITISSLGSIISKKKLPTFVRFNLTA